MGAFQPTPQWPCGWPPAQAHRSQSRHLARFVAHIVGRVVAKLPRPAVAPALEIARVQDCARVTVPRRDSDGGAVGPQVHRSQSRHLARLVALIVGRVVAELPIHIQAPALEVTRVQDRARVICSKRDRDVCACGLGAHCSKSSRRCSPREAAFKSERRASDAATSASEAAVRAPRTEARHQTSHTMFWLVFWLGLARAM